MPARMGEQGASLVAECSALRTTRQATALADAPHGLEHLVRSRISHETLDLAAGAVDQNHRGHAMYSVLVDEGFHRCGFKGDVRLEHFKSCRFRAHLRIGIGGTLHLVARDAPIGDEIDQCRPLRSARYRHAVSAKRLPANGAL